MSYLAETNFRSRSRNTIAEHSFAKAPASRFPRSSFSRSHGVKTTFNDGDLIPIYLDEIYPGDTFAMSASFFCRISTLLFPIMDNLYFHTCWFFVPYRLVWDNFIYFMGEQNSPFDTTDFLVPTFSVSNPGVNSLFDYMGLPIGTFTLIADALWPRAYNLIWNNWFRDENLQDSVTVHTDNGPDGSGVYNVLKVNKYHDYFTSCLPWPQKINDNTDVFLPLSGLAQVDRVNLAANPWITYKVATNTPVTAGPLTPGSGGPGDVFADDGVSNPQVNFDPNGSLVADLSTISTSISINTLRQTIAFQQFFELDARTGTRYPEIVVGHFGSPSPDSRLQRPELLGCHRTPMNIHAVPQTSSTASTNFQGDLAGYGTMVAHKHGFKRSFTEHGVVVGLAYVRADLNYSQGMNRAWSRQTRYDFYDPLFANLGEQAVLNKEIFYQGSITPDNGVFGYQEAWAELRYKPSLITSYMRPEVSLSLAAWHLSQSFGSLPTLNDAFIQEQAPLARVKAASSSVPDFLLDGAFDLKCARVMPTYSVPGLHRL